MLAALRTKLPHAGESPVPTIAARAVAKLLELLASLGRDRPALARDAGIELEGLDDPDARVPLSGLHRLWEAGVAFTGRRDLPLAQARRYQTADYQLVGFACMSSANLAEALGTMVRYLRLWTDEPVLELAAPGRFTLRYRADFPPSLGLACATEAAFAEIVNASSAATGQRIPVRSARFSHQAPDDQRPFDEYFGVPVEFGAPGCELELDPSALQNPLPPGDPRLGEFLRSLASEALARHGDAGGLRGQVADLVSRHLKGGVPSERDIARAMGMSERTMRRRLDAEGLQFRQLVDTIRADLGRSYVRDRRLSLGEITFLLGFSEPSAFHRAFKRWTGFTPTQFRAGGG